VIEVPPRSWMRGGAPPGWPGPVNDTPPGPPPGDDGHGSLAGNSLRVLAGQVAGNAGYFVAVLELAHGLRPAQRGAVAFVTVAALITGTVSALGAGDAVKVLAARRPAIRPRLLTNLALLTLATSLAGAALAVGALALVPGARPARVGRVELLMLVEGTVAAAGAAAAASFLQGCSRFRAYTRAVAGSPWLYAALLAGSWAWHGLTVGHAIAAWVVAQAVPGLLLWVVCARVTSFGAPDVQLARETLAFGVRAWIGSLAHFLNARSDQVLLGVMASEATLGVYAVAVNGSEMLFYLPSAAGAALVPAIARAEALGGAASAARAFRVVFVLTCAAVAAAALLGPPLLPVVFGAPYAASATPFLLLLPGAFGFAASSIFSSALLAARAPTLSSLGPLVSLTVQVVLDLLLIPRHGASGAAVAASAALLAGGATAAFAYCMRVRLRPTALVPRFEDLAPARLAIRRIGAIRS
jgi:O-antigen/teichoic acid export membrane protein